MVLLTFSMCSGGLLHLQNARSLESQIAQCVHFAAGELAGLGVEDSESAEHPFFCIKHCCACIETDALRTGDEGV